MVFPSNNANELTSHANCGVPAMALPPAFGLPALPLELLLRVLRLLDIHSVVRLSAVNRHFSAAAADWMLWRHLYLRDFKGGRQRF